ncbi:hypothetical protein PCANC_13962 [Puccinia coronata f. sp. avenae]|uniref:Uncharacterized protein n=1 Tax=Puccinia coronata f. sp. avenae TaxID=200324 RepID=A0A2N5UGH2_9BASI|nr:hypothetical protein PCANC_13962 [Puccinia coronata f. sp. avenae]
MHQHQTHSQHPTNTSLSSSNPTVQPPPNVSPITNVNELPNIPYCCVPANHPMFTQYFNKNTNPTTPSPDPRPSPQSAHHSHGHLNSALKEFRLQQQGDEDRKKTATTINAAVNQIREHNRLLVASPIIQGYSFDTSGIYLPTSSHSCTSVLSTVNQRIFELANQFIYNVEFFTKRCVHIHSKQVGRAIILNLVDPSLEDQLSSFNTCHKVFSNLSTRFSSVCCSAKMALFMKLLQVNPDSFTTVSAFATEIRDTIAKLKALNLTLNDNSIMGLILQMNLQNGPVWSSARC